MVSPCFWICKRSDAGQGGKNGASRGSLRNCLFSEMPQMMRDTRGGISGRGDAVVSDSSDLPEPSDRNT